MDSPDRELIRVNGINTHWFVLATNGLPGLSVKTDRGTTIKVVLLDRYGGLKCKKCLRPISATCWSPEIKESTNVCMRCPGGCAPLRPYVEASVIGRCNNDGCGLMGLMRCARCECGWYCSPNCQKEHWIVHKSLCPTNKR